MANGLHKILFSISVISPPSVIASVVSIATNGWSIWRTIAFLVGMLLSIYDFLLVILCKRHLEKVKISLETISPNDSWCIAYATTYIIPCLSFVLKPFTPTDTWIIAIIIGVVFLASNIIPPNPILRLCGYHFYKATSVDGTSGYNLISRRGGIHNKKAVNMVICVSDYILIEEEKDDIC